MCVNRHRYPGIVFRMTILRILAVTMLAAAAAIPLAAQDLPRPVTVPRFAVESLDDPGVLISDESLHGKTCLVDFWASWCPPCVEEIPVLAKAYEQYRDRKFEILSLSFDRSPDQVRAFRSKRFAMPWLHAFVERGFGSYIAQAFGVENIPHQVLIGPDGRILAVDDELRGEKLAQTLESILR